MPSNEFYELAWRTARRGLGELDYMLRPLGLSASELEISCARSQGVQSMTDLNIALRFSCAVIALAASMSSELSSFITEAALSPGSCSSLSPLLDIIVDLVSSLRRDLLEEGATYNVMKGRLLRAALSIVDILDKEAQLLSSLCGQPYPEKL